MKEGDIIQKAKPYIVEIHDEFPQFKALKDLQSELVGVIDYPVELSRIMLEITGNLAGIGVLVAKLNSNSNESYSNRKKRLQAEYMKVSGTVDDRKALAREITEVEHETELIDKYIYEVVRSFYNDCERLITVIQSRLKVLQSERISSNAQ